MEKFIKSFPPSNSLNKNMENQIPTNTQPIPAQNVPVEQAPTPPPFTPHNSLNWLKLLIIGVVVLLVTSIFGIGGYLLGSNKNTPSQLVQKPTPLPTKASVKAGDPVSNAASATANWKTYTTSEFTFKYPADKYTVEERDKGYFAIKPIDVLSGFAGIMIDNRMLGGSYDKVVSDLKLNLVNPKVEALANGVKISGTFGPPKQPGMSLEGTEIIDAYLKNNSSYVKMGTIDKSSFAIFDQILSTFKFIN